MTSPLAVSFFIGHAICCPMTPRLTPLTCMETMRASFRRVPAGRDAWASLALISGAKTGGHCARGDSNCYAKPEHVKLHMQTNKKAECLPNHVISNFSCHQQVLQKCLGVNRLPGKCYACDHEMKKIPHSAESQTNHSPVGMTGNQLKTGGRDMLEASTGQEAMTCMEPAQDWRPSHAMGPAQDWRPANVRLEARSRREAVVKLMHRQKPVVTPQNTDPWKLGQPRGLMTCKETGARPEASYGDTGHML